MPKRRLIGVVVSDKSNKTISVLVERRVMDTDYHKVITRSKKYSVHDEKNQYKVGDIVTIEEHIPISKTKKWVVVQS